MDRLKHGIMPTALKCSEQSWPRLFHLSLRNMFIWLFHEIHSALSSLSRILIGELRLVAALIWYWPMTFPETAEVFDWKRE
jgi:hypothetical protein